MTKSSLRPPIPIESFGAPILNALIEGSKRKFEVSMTYRDAVNFRFRCHKLRNRMREDKHPMASVVTKTKIRIEWDQEKIHTLFTKNRVPYPKDSGAMVTLIIEPHDNEFTEALAKAGIDVNKPVTLEGQAPPESQPSDSPPPSLDQLLGDLK